MLYGIHKVSVSLNRSLLTNISFRFNFFSHDKQNRSAWMLPEIVLNILTLLLCLAILIMIPVCDFAFWNETRHFFIDFATIWLSINASNTRELMIILWVTIAVATGLCEIQFFYQLELVFV